jgi:hypothetical protein
MDDGGIAFRETGARFGGIWLQIDQIGVTTPFVKKLYIKGAVALLRWLPLAFQARSFGL